MRDASTVTVPSEHSEQCSLFDWAALYRGKYPELDLMFAVPNGARTSISVAKKLKAEGLKAGIPDIILPVPRGTYHGMFLEMKRVKGGRVESEQKEWHDKLRAHGYYVAIARGWEDAVSFIQFYLNQRSQGVTQ